MGPFLTFFFISFYFFFFKEISLLWERDILGSIHSGLTSLRRGKSEGKY